MSLTLILMLTIDIILFTIKSVYKDITKIAVVLFMFTYFIFLVISFGKFMIWIVPKYFPNEKEVIYNLFSTSFSALITAIIGFIAVYFGAVYGGNKATENMERQFQVEKENQEKIEEKNKKVLTNTIAKLIKEEVQHNAILIYNTHFFQYLDKGYGTQYGYNFNEELKFYDYNKIKYELIKYYELNIVEEVIDLYSLFYILSRNKDINQLTEKEYIKMTSLDEKLKNFLKE
ncbi:hypothetical protein [Clostridium cylindrosporum]|nr:hypothetical protein [Clostridium cylindrosporum]